MTGPGCPHHMQTSQPPFTASAKSGAPIATARSISDADDSGTVDKLM